MSYLEAFILALIEGLTEFLPVSSTGHMIFASAIQGNEKDEFVKLFQVSIQFGAILAVVWLYWRKFLNFKSINFYVKLTLAVIPALVLGKLFDDKIESVLEKPIPIAIALIVGGVILLFVDRLFRHPKIDKEEKITVRKAIVVGFWQCLAMMPGTSRSAASIIGGMQQGMTRKVAAEFSFFLAVPTMLAVTAYSMFLKDWKIKGIEKKGFEMVTENSHNLTLFLLGNIVAFLVAAFAIKFFIGIVQKYGFKIWGVYRILAGTILIIYFTCR
ncbi:MAG: undecaprenyl-diphosphate phosphatase [Fluviicola sp.]|jgi:undecaprenyl-diphosphatase